MGQHISKVLGSVLVGVLLAFLITGCGNSGGGTSGAGSGGGQTPPIVIGAGAGDTLPPSVTTVQNPNPDTFQPQGNIQGVVRDAVTALPLVGAQVSMSIPGASLGVTTVTTGASGQFSFANVPASTWNDAAPADGIVQFAELSAYTITVDLTFVNGALPGSAAKYPKTAFGQAAVGFANFTDGNNALLCAGITPPAVGPVTCSPTEGGSGASTPVSGTTTTLNFDIGRMTEAITGKVRDAENGNFIANATVTLLDVLVPAGAVTPTPAPAAGPAAGGIRLSLDNTTVTTAADGTFFFPSVPAVHCFNVEAQAAGYTESGTLTMGLGPVCTNGGSLTVLVPATPASLGDLDGSGAIVCPAECLGTPGAGEILLAPAIPGVDTTPPYVEQASPADGADIDVTTATGNPQRPIVLTFSEPMQDDNGFTRPIVATVDFKGLPIPGPGATGPEGVVNATTAWSNGPNGRDTVLTITPRNNWQVGVTYGVFLGVKPAPLTPTSPVVDLAGNACCRPISLNVLGNLLTGAVFGEAAPTPATLLFTTNGGPSVLDGPAARLGANSADFNQSTATINWDAVAGARAYEVYMSIAGGDFQLIARTLPGNSPVTTLLSRSWSFADAMNAATPGTVGVNPSAPVASATNPAATLRASPGYEILAAGRRVVEGFIPDVGDDVSPIVGAVDTADGFADLSDNFGTTSQVRIAIATLNSNGVIGTLGSPVTVRDNTGPTANVAPPAGSTVLPICTLGAPCALAASLPIATTWRGERVQDLFDVCDRDSDLITFEPDGVPDTILLGLSEPLGEATAECTSAASCAAIYQLRAADGTVPARLSAISIVSATYDEDTNGNGVLDPGEDINGNGRLDRGSNVDDTTIKGNDFGNTFVWLRIAPATACTAGVPNPVDIRAGDHVAFVVDPAKTGTSNGVLSDLASNGARAVDQTLAQNILADINLPQVVSAVATNNAPGTPDTIVVTFNEALGGFALGAPFGLRIAGVDCSATVTVSPAFTVGASSVTLQVTAGAAPPTDTCDLSRLAGDGTASSDIITFGAGTVDLAGNILLPERNAFIFSSAAGAFVVTNTTAIVALPPDTTAPTLTAATVLNSAGATADIITLTFNERLGAITAANFLYSLGNRTSACAIGATVVNTPAFVTGDTTVTLSVTGGSACDVATFNPGTTGAAGTGDVIALGTPTSAGQFVTDVAGNALNGVTDHAVNNAAIAGAAAGSCAGCVIQAAP